MKLFKPKCLILMAIWLLCHANLVAQQKDRFLPQIRDFQKQDSVSFPSKNSILFTGSSSIRLWKNLQSDFPDHRIINRGFGGSTLPEVEMYANDIIFPYRPKQIVIYCGENDLTASNITADSVFVRFESLFHAIRNKARNVNIVYISMKPSPSRTHLMAEMERGNRMIRKFLEGHKRASYLDVYSLMLDENGSPREELFVKDMLHLNEKGYAIWKEALKPYLKKTK